MQKSQNQQKNNEDSSNHSVSTSFTSNNHNEPQNSNGFVSMLSPRNIMKFLSKNIQQMASPRISAIMVSSGMAEVRVSSRFSAEEIHQQFQKYTENIKNQIQKYKILCLKNMHMTGFQANKQQQRQQIQQQIKISKIPQQYFYQWEDSQKYDEQGKFRSKQKHDTVREPINKQNGAHKSLKLHNLLMIGNEQKSKGRSKQKRRPLYDKQIQLQGYLDQIQIVIFNKTRKYPDRYLHYLANLNNSDFQINNLLARVSNIRIVLGEQQQNVRQKQLRVVSLQKKKKNVQQALDLINIMKSLYKFKKLSSSVQKPKQPLNLQQPCDKSHLRSSQLIKFIHKHPKSSSVYKIGAIAPTLTNAQQLIKTIRSKKLQKICKQLHKNLSTKLNTMYSRQQWLKSQLPKDVLMVHRMKPEVQKFFPHSPHDELNNMNSSLLNISVLDQSYCVAANSMSTKKQAEIFNSNDLDICSKQLMEDWKAYFEQFMANNKKHEQQQQHVFQIFQRVLLKFTMNFNRDLQDYISYIYSQKSNNSKVFQSHQDRLNYIQPKFFNKITKVFYQSLSITFNFSLIFTGLSNFQVKLLALVQEKLKEIIELKKLTDFSLVQNQIICYEDIFQILNSLDYWFRYLAEIGDKVQTYLQVDQQEQLSQKLISFQESLINKKKQIVEQFLANLHKFALVQDLKMTIEKSNFSTISIPVSSFSVLDFIINWGQSSTNQGQNLNSIKINEMDQSFNFGSSFLADLDHDKKQVKGSKKFSIFKVVDKKLIIEGKQYKICDSTIALCLYLGVYLRAKIDFPESIASVDERICEIIGFYIWYCKKMIFTAQNKQDQSSPTVSSKTVTRTSQINRKTINNLCLLANLCDLLAKFMDILNITTKPKKVDKVLADLQSIKNDCIKQIGMIPFLQVEQQISSLYQSRLKTRKQIPTKQSLNILSIIQNARSNLQENYEKDLAKKGLENTIKMICKNYFGFLLNMEARGKSELKWFVPQFKQLIGDIFQQEIINLQKQLRH